MQKVGGKGSDTAAILTGPLTDWAEYGTCLWYQALKNGVNSYFKSCCRNAAAFYKLYFMV